MSIGNVPDWAQQDEHGREEAEQDREECDVKHDTGINNSTVDARLPVLCAHDRGDR
jgi:hypothetical protein